ncbi:insulin-like [Pollicipes pollicipes]|uniref:insulin-like n=1 Tax=Pollicipes pollicipes TaxID=41117 RepID=UPI0018851852|nr:insulin-like [Pollicipes pollicipes]
MASLRLYAAALLLATCYQHVLARDLLRPPPHKRQAYFCGSALIEAMQLVCGSAGIGGASGKRTTADALIGYRRDRLPNELTEVPARARPYAQYSRQRLLETLDPLSDPERRAAGQPEHLRVKRQGIVDECCYHPCTINTLKSYCELA